MSEHHALPLWRQLQAVAAVVAQVQQGHSLTAALEATEAALRPGVQALAFEVLRHWGQAQAVRRLLAPKAPAPAVEALLCSALALAAQGDQARYTAFTLVNQAVEASKRQIRLKPQAGFINGCLRRFLRERDALLAGVGADPVAVWNHPDWWVRRLRQDHPQAWQQVLSANNLKPPMTLRVNTRQCSPEAYQALLQAQGMASDRVGASGLRLAQPCPVGQLPHFEQGWVSVQDAAAQLAAPLLVHALTPKDTGRARVLDACAAPGGKTLHLLEMADLDVTALEVDPQRAQRIHDNLRRTGLQARVVTADAAETEQWWDGQWFDGVLLDAPCTASGIVRRHPDVRWLRRPSDVDQLAVVQQGLLQRLWPLLRPGGVLLYCTCSVFKAEGQQQVETFLAHNTDSQILPSPGHLLPGMQAPDTAVPDNALRDHDGFFYALLRKQTP